MRVGIVGSEGAKFTAGAKARAVEAIRRILTDEGASEVVSGACHLGGIDAWAADVGRELGLRVTEFPPRTRAWESGYKPRNLKIAENSDVVYCVTLDHLPDNWTGMRFPTCYHCGTNSHVKSGGCWTVKQAQRMGKRGEWRIIQQSAKSPLE